MSDFIRVECRLASAMVGDPPQLDALLELVMSGMTPKAIGRSKVDRARPCPLQGEVPIPIQRQRLGGWGVARCSSPIFVARSDRHEHYGKKLVVEHAGLLAAGERKTVNTTGDWTKSYRLPLRVRDVPRVVWFAQGDRREMLKLLRRKVLAVGKKTSVGYGRVGEWVVDRIDFDAVWWAGSPGGPVLMRPLPAGPWLPKGLAGYRTDYGACCPPYWHQDRHTEIVVPC